MNSKDDDIDDGRISDLLTEADEVMEVNNNLLLVDEPIKEMENILLKIYTPTKNKWLNPTDNFGKF
ncbi:hypothetical protein QWY81_06595 [Polaribacter undariae]|uniref:Uncharacterized protein n=1 Tax=Polaribacter sejongensis TaxID=985043 RepID=A0AAJ1VFS0_9FLAO|nr:hypothetical protein [Polaribacter undariae]MDN3619123.1 hypothetical protein [Polaribacter undariae]UWD33675.1 hypothetical protein NQP51_08375 [Polaribacter undariae]